VNEQTELCECEKAHVTVDFSGHIFQRRAAHSVFASDTPHTNAHGARSRLLAPKTFLVSIGAAFARSRGTDEHEKRRVSQ